MFAHCSWHEIYLHPMPQDLLSSSPFCLCDLLTVDALWNHDITSLFPPQGFISVLSLWECFYQTYTFLLPLILYHLLRETFSRSSLPCFPTLYPLALMFYLFIFTAPYYLKLSGMYCIFFKFIISS